MKVQIIFAPSRSTNRLADLPESINAPLGPLYLAAYLRAHLPGLELTVTDGLRIGWDQTLERVRSCGADLVLVSFLTPVARAAYALVDQVKRISPGALVAVGGPHVTTFPDEPFTASSADFAAIGEGEQTALELARAVAGGRRTFEGIDGLVWRGPNGVVRNGPREFIHDLDSIPFPAWDLIDLKDYNGWFVTKRKPETIILSSRGCPFNCTFCTNVVWKSSRPWQRVRSPKSVADEMAWLHREFGVNEVFDHADELNGNLRHALALCEEIKARKLDMPWKAQVRAHPLPDELARAMAEAGVWYVHLGIESGNDRTLKGIRKHVTREQVVAACQALKKYGIKVFGLFMLFNVWEEDGALAFEGVEETRRTLEFARGLVDRRLLDYISSTVATPYPGSQLYDTARKFNLIDDAAVRDWDSWLTEKTFLMDLPGVSKREAAAVYRRASLLRARCYLRSGNWGLKEVPLFLKKALRAFSIS